MVPLVLSLVRRGRCRELRESSTGVFQNIAERTLPAQVEVQCAHAHTQGQGALANRALKTALGRLAPGSVQVLQGIQAQPGRYRQRRCAVIALQMRFDGGDQRLRINPQQNGLLLGLNFER